MQFTTKISQILKTTKNTHRKKIYHYFEDWSSSQISQVRNNLKKQTAVAILVVMFCFLLEFLGLKQMNDGVCVGTMLAMIVCLVCTILVTLLFWFDGIKPRLFLIVALKKAMKRILN
jgi:hypothetical protein